MSIHEDLKAFVDGELSEARTQEVRAAVDNDPALQQEVQFMKLLGREIQETALVPEIRGADEAINAVRHRRWPLKLIRNTLIVAIGVAVFAAVSLPLLNKPEYAASDAATPAAPTDVLSVHTGGTGRLALKKAATSAPAETPTSDASPQMHEQGLLMAPSGKAAAGPPSPEDNDVARKTVTGATKIPKPESYSPQFHDAHIQSTVSPHSNRKIVQNGELALSVEDVQDAQTKATNIATGVAGFVENSSLDYDSDNLPKASLTLRIPSAQFSDVLQKLQGLGKVTSNHVTGTDVTAQYADTDARLKELGAEEDSYVTMLRGAKTIGQILEIKDRLSQVRQDMASLHAQLEALKDQSTLSTITLSLEQKPKPGNPVPQKPETKDTWAQDSWAVAVNGLSSVGRFLGQVCIYLFVFSPLWLPAAIGLWWLNRKARKS